MYEIRLHGLGGEGVVVASELLGKAAMKQGKWSHSFPFFGTDIRGAAVKAFTRIDDRPIAIKSYIYKPDTLLIFNDILLSDPDVAVGVSTSTLVLVNTELSPEVLGESELGKLGAKIIPIKATELGYQCFNRPIFNTIMLGALLKVQAVVDKDILCQVIAEEFPSKLAEANVAALEKGYQSVERMDGDETSLVS
ncbi:2-oxoacid:acceptor oxidoreductase family protein [Zhaonella formicivorans]|uniref:2-oxoacid:acceptor oxidoreductase family protein n=1 Tax=Zhaonella formicivorans TaxID=2528593 RepID=UPI001D1275E5|nr:2-oxoacid:acceptor oxidoreductase family protein [Zhaonella formicivorans]